MTRIHPILFTTLSFLFCACTEQLHSLDEVTQTSLGAEGGTATSAAGELSLQFPAGLLAAGSSVQIRTDRSTVLNGLLSPVFDLSVTPALASFDPPVQLRITADGRGQAVTVVNLNGLTPVPIEGAVYDAATHVVTAPLRHFSRYAAMTVATDCPEQAPSGSCSEENLRCEYGEECCCGQCHPSLVYTCSGGQWAGLNTDACLGAAITCPDAGAPTCPAEAPSGACSAEGLSCNYGEECCCGQCHPSLVYTCSAGQWAGHNTDACLAPQCPDAGTPTCPTNVPSGACSDEGLSCDYGEECCCGQCHPSLVYTCNGGQWAGHNTDACLSGQCPDAG